MRQDGNGISKIELSIFVFKRTIELIDGKMSEDQSATAPFNVGRIVISSAHLTFGQRIPVSDDTATSASEIQDRPKLPDVQSVPGQNISDALRSDYTLSQERLNAVLIGD
jgi:hypothetical protein